MHFISLWWSLSGDCRDSCPHQAWIAVIRTPISSLLLFVYCGFHSSRYNCRLQRALNLDPTWWWSYTSIARLVAPNCCCCVSARLLSMRPVIPNNTCSHAAIEFHQNLILQALEFRLKSSVSRRALSRIVSILLTSFIIICFHRPLISFSIPFHARCRNDSSQENQAQV